MEGEIVIERYNPNYKINRVSEEVTENTNVSPKGCTGITFINEGDDDAKVIGISLPAGEERVFTGELYTIDVTEYDVLFLSVVNPKIIVVRSYLTRL